MQARKYLIRLGATLLAIVLPLGDRASAVIVTRAVTFFTNEGSQGNQISIHGTLDTLAQGLREVPFGVTSVGVHGTLTADITFNVPGQGQPVEVMDVTILSNSFAQQDLALFYDVPGTQRRVAFAASDIKFSINAEGSQQQPLSLLQTSSVNIPGNSLQIEQNEGFAEINITNRPPRQQILSQQGVLSSYVNSSPQIDQLTFLVMPSGQVPNGFIVDLNLPLTNQQLLYSGVGLPVTLNYSGGLNLLSPLISLAVPEPTGLVLLATCAGGMMLRRSRRHRD